MLAAYDGADAILGQFPPEVADWRARFAADGVRATLSHSS